MRDGVAYGRDFEATHRDDVADARDATAIIREARADEHCWLKSVPMLVVLGVLVAFSVAQAVQAVQISTTAETVKGIQSEQSSMREHLAEIHVIRQMVEDIRNSRSAK
jgi:hypothetical protein